MGELIDDEVKELVDNSYKRAEEILKENIDKLHLLAEKLLEFEKIEAEEFEELFTTGNITKRTHEEMPVEKKDESAKKAEKNPAKAEDSFSGNPLTES